MGHELCEALARSGAGWVNLRPETATGLAHQVAGKELAEKGITFLTGQLATAVVEEIYHNLEKQKFLLYFARDSYSPGLVRAIASSIFELRYCGVAEEDRAPEEKEQVLSLIIKIMQSTIWQRMLQSKKRFVEVPFSVKVEEGKQDFKGDTVISGVIDLVFLEDGGWVIVDYKTDTVENEESLANLVRYYRPQVEMYRRFWEEIAKEKVCEAGLYFTHVDRWVGV